MSGNSEENNLKMVRLKRKNSLSPLPKGSKLVARPSRWGNPFNLIRYSPEKSLSLYRIWLNQKIRENPDFLKPLEGKNLACYCDLDKPCHADILIEYLEPKLEVVSFSVLKGTPISIESKSLCVYSDGSTDSEIKTKSDVNADKR